MISVLVAHDEMYEQLATSTKPSSLESKIWKTAFYSTIRFRRYEFMKIIFLQVKTKQHLLISFFSIWKNWVNVLLLGLAIELK